MLIVVYELVPDYLDKPGYYRVIGRPNGFGRSARVVNAREDVIYDFDKQASFLEVNPASGISPARNQAFGKNGVIRVGPRSLLIEDNPVPRCGKVNFEARY